ncbi:hypothetical protein JJB09_04545 [Rhizobium sp. KVB221]|uniref:Calcium-binding protein n=1 Tax=Rhizobium setariae TaxID=2801340 RepID=A0A936YJ99_9HYPH|nr:calcium-binding protein [Rhizobium setariae]MBL0371290.1 hypothetical protein [Rhizobium setariae]
MGLRKRYEDDDHDDNRDHGHHDDWRDDDNDDESDFDFDTPELFKFDFDGLNLKKFGKITDYDISHDHLSVTFGNVWTFSVDGDGLDFTLKGNSKLPAVTGGTIDSFTIDGPGKADFAISDLDMSAKAFYKALVNLDGHQLINLVLGGDETISGSGFGDFIHGGRGNDAILGNKGADRLAGDSGNDVIDGGAGNDYISSGSGADTLVFAPKSGHDLVADFDASNDVLDLTAYGIQGSVEDFLAEHVRFGDDDHGGRCRDDDDNDDDGGDVIIDLGQGNAIKLEEIDRWDLGEHNILL